MKPLFVCIRQSYILSVVLIMVSATQSLQAQQILEAIDNPHSQADYIIISPPSYTTIMQDFATHRATYSNLRVVIVTTDAIYQVFGQGTRPDSAIRAFMTYVLTSWINPKPQYFLLAGNVNTVPSHKEGPIIPGFEDSVMVDQWFVEGVPDTIPYRRPAAAIGRMPGWDVPHMTMILWKTMQYDQSSGTGWRNRVLTVADYEINVGSIFEDAAQRLQMLFAPRWTDTITVHVRTSSPLYRTRAQFRALWNAGAAIVTFIGMCNRTIFSNSYYFTTADIDSLADGSPFPLVRFMGSQRFENRDTLSLTTQLLLMPWKGAVCGVSPSGLAYFSETQYFTEQVAHALAANPAQSIGKIILNVKRQEYSSEAYSRETLLGDPALVVKNPLLAGGGGGGDVAQAFSLHQNFPNPFNPTTQIAFDLPQAGVVTLKLFNLLGQELGTLLSGSMDAGTHTYTLNADAFRLGSGVYFYRLIAGDFVQTRKMIFMK
jgi:hypothetical protein